MNGGGTRCEGEAKRFQTYFLITDMQCFLALLWVYGYFQFLGQGWDGKFRMCHYEGAGEKNFECFIFSESLTLGPPSGGYFSYNRNFTTPRICPGDHKISTNSIIYNILSPFKPIGKNDTARRF